MPGKASFQSNDFLYLEVNDYVGASAFFGDEDDEPFFSRDMRF